MQAILHYIRSKAVAKDLVSRLLRGAALALLMNVLGFSFGFLAQLVVGRTLGPGGFGVYAYVQAWVSFLAMLCGLGLPFALLRFVPEYKAKDDWPLAREVIRHTERWVAMVSIAAALIGALLATIFADRLGPTYLWTIYAGLVAMPLLALLRVWCYALRGFGRIVSALGSDLPIREGLTFAIIAAFGLGIPLVSDAPTAMLVWTFGTAVGVLVSLLAWRRHEKPAAWHQSSTIDAAIRSQWLKVALTLLVVQSLAMLIRRLDLFVVGWSFDNEDLGVYAAASRIAEIMIFPTYVLNAYFAPTISELSSQDDKASLQKATTLTANIALGSALLLALPLLLVPDIVLGLFGPEFTRGASVLRFMAIGELVVTSIPFATIMLTMTGHERAAVRLMIIASALTFLALILAGSFGTIESVALTRSACVILTQLSFCWLIQRMIKIVPFPFARVRPT